MSTFKLHRAQAYVLQHEARFKVVVSGRRFGKSSLQLVKLLGKTLTPHNGQGIRPTVLGTAPTHPQVRAVLFQPFLDFCWDMFGDDFERVAKVNRTLMTVDFGRRYPLLKFSGAHGAAAERLRGLKLTHASVDEAKDVSYSFLSKVIFPALADLQGTALFTGTPGGRNNTLYKLYTETNPEFQSFNFSSYANTLVPGFKDSLDKLRKLLPRDDFEAEILGRFTDAVGGYYSCYRADYFGAFNWGRPVAFLVGFDPGSRNRGYVICGQYLHEGLSKFKVLHAVMESDVGLDSEILDRVALELHSLRASFQTDAKTLFIAVDPSRPELVTELRRKRLNGLKATNAFDAGINVVNALFWQERLAIQPVSSVDGTSLGWFAEQVEDYHRATNPMGEILDREANDIATHALDGFRYCFATLNKHTPDLLGTAALLPQKGTRSVIVL